MSANNISMLSIMFEEIKQLLKQLLEHNKEQAINQLDINLQELETKIEVSHEKKNNLILEKLSQLENSILEPKIQKHQHRIVIDIQSSWAFFSLIGMFFIIFLSGLLHIKQVDKNLQLRDNDLKYRYIKAFNKTDSVSIYKLENIFHYNRDEKMIRQIQEGVKLYEELLLKRARWLEEERLKNRKLNCNP